MTHIIFFFQTQGDCLVITNTCKILELAVPLMSNPNPEFVRQLENDLLMITSKQGMAVMESAVACLGAVVNKVTQRHDYVIQSLQKLTAGLHNFLMNHRKNPTAEIPKPTKGALLRNLYLIGLLFKNFDFEGLNSDKTQSPSDNIMKYYLYFCQIGDDDIKHKSLMGLGFFCTRYFNCLLTDQLRNLYQQIMSSNRPNAAKFKVQVLKNIYAGLKMQEANPIDDSDNKEKQNSDSVAPTSADPPHYQDDLKEMFDVQAGLASNVTQTYLGQILNSYFDKDLEVRTAAADVILLIVAHGLIHPAKCVPYLIAATTDPCRSIKQQSEQRLKDIEKRYPNFIWMKAVQGARKSYELQQVLQRVAGEEPIRGIVAGVKDDPGSNSVDSAPATLTAIYSILRSNRQHRRAFIVSLIKLFDETSDATLGELVYLADNMVYFPYGTLDELFHTIAQIEQHISISGTNLIQSIKDICVAHHQQHMALQGNEYQQMRTIIPEDEEEFFQAQHLYGKPSLLIQTIIQYMFVSLL